MSEQANSVAAAAPQTEEASHFESLLDKAFVNKPADVREDIKSAVGILAGEALKNVKLISEDTTQSIQRLIAEIDKMLTSQVNEIIHQEAFRTLEGSWRGLHHLINNSTTDETLKIKVMNISKKDLGRSLRKFKGVTWDQSPLFKQIYEHEYGQFGGNPYGCLVGDYAFDHSPQDVEILAEMAQVAGAAHAPFIASAAPSLFGMGSYRQLADPRDLTKIFSTPAYAAWKSLRESDDSRYIGLTMPRYLARLPYGAKTTPVEEFSFEEDTGSADHEKYVWSNSAYAMAVNINRAFKNYGWCAQIRGVESGGSVEGLPAHTFPTDDGGIAMKCPTEIAIGDRREAELASLGFMPLLHRKNTDMAAFIGAQSLQKPQEYDTDEATANANLSARLPYLFATCRFAHYLKQMVRDKIGSFADKDSLTRYLNRWITNYVEPDAKASDEAKALRPLAEARVDVVEDESNPGYFSSTFFLRPHYQLEGLRVSLRLVAKLPKPA